MRAGAVGGRADRGAGGAGSRRRGAAAGLARARDLGGESADARARAIGIWAGIGSLGLVAGPLLGGALAGWLGWRAVFWASVPVCAAALAGLRWVADSRAARSAPRVDLAGQVAGTVALAALAGALIEGRRLGWGSTPVVGGLAVAAAAVAAFVAAELRAAWPVLDLRFFRDRGFSASNLGAGLMNLGVLGSLFVLSLLLQARQGLSPAAAGVRITPLALPLAVVPPLAARVIRRSGPRLPAALGLAGTGAGFLALALLGAGAPYAEMLAPLLLAGISLGFATPGLVTGATSSVPPERAGMAAAVNNTARQTGGAIGVALIGGVTGAGGFALSAAALLTGAVAVAASTPKT